MKFTIFCSLLLLSVAAASNLRIAPRSAEATGSAAPNPFKKQEKDPLPVVMDTAPKEFKEVRHVVFRDLVNAVQPVKGGLRYKKVKGLPSYQSGASSKLLLEENSEVKGIAFSPRSYQNTKVGLSYENGKEGDHRNIDYAIYLHSNRELSIVETGTGRMHNMGYYLPGDDISVTIAKSTALDGKVVHRVEYRVNGNMRYTSQKRPVFPLKAEVAFHNDADEEVRNFRFVGEAQQYAQKPGQFVQFTGYELAAYEAGPGRIKKVTHGSNWNSGVLSVNCITESNKITGVSFVADQYKTAIFGLARHDNKKNMNDIDFGIYLDSSRNVQIYENGQHKKGVIQRYKINDIFQVRINQANQVEYVQNDDVIYTSSSNVLLPLYVDTHLYHTDASFSKIRWLGEQAQLVEKKVGAKVQFTKFDGLVSEEAGEVRKAENGLGNAWNAGATSLQAIKDGDEVNGFSFVPDTQSVGYIAGLQRAKETPKTGSQYNLIDHGMYIHHNSYVYIYEKGRQVGGHYAKWNKGDVCEVRLDARGYIEYLVNGRVVYTSITKAVLPLYAAVTVHNQNTGVSHLTWTGSETENVPVAVDNKVVWTQFRYTSSKGPGFVSNNEGNSQNSWHNTARTVGAITEDLAKKGVRGISFRPMRNNQHQGAGLTSKEKITHYNDITYFMMMDSSHNVNIYEQGNHRGHVGKYEPGDKMEVVVNRENVVEYWVNDEVRYTSKLSVSFPLYGAASMYNIGSRLHSVTWVGYKRDEAKPKKAGGAITFTKFQHTHSDRPGDLRVSTNRQSNWNNGAFSYHMIEKTDNIKGIEFIIGRKSMHTAVGLTDAQYDRKDNNVNHMTFACYFSSNNHIYVYEKGQQITSFGTYEPGDKFQIRVRSDGRVEYVRNGSVRYTSSKYAQYPLYMDVSLYNFHSFIKNSKWVQK